MKRRADDDDGGGADPAAAAVKVKRAKRCAAHALCPACAAIDARVRAQPEEATPLALWLLGEFTGCSDARSTYARAYREAAGVLSSPLQLAAGTPDGDSDSDSDTTDRPPLPLPQEQEHDALPPLPPHQNVGAWRAAPGFEARIAALQRRFTPDSNTRNAHPRAARIRTVFTSTLHDYYVDNALCNAATGWYSVSGLLHFLFPSFDAAFKSRCSAEGVLRDLLYAGVAASDRRQDVPLDTLWQLKAPAFDVLAAAFPHADTPDDKLVPPPQRPLPTLRAAYDAARVDALVQVGAKSLRAAWDLNRDSGSAKHAAFDAWLQHLPLPAAMPLAAMPLGFFRSMAMLSAAGYDVFGTEVSICDEAARFLGQVDLLLRHRESGRLLLGDFKNCRDKDLATAGAGRGACGVHPFTTDTPDTKLAHYEIQLGSYWHVLNTLYYPGGQMEERAVLLNYRPDEPDEFYAYWVVPRDMAPLWRLLPWRTDDPRHAQFAPSHGRQLLVQPVPDADARCRAPGPTTRCGPPLQPTPPDVVWTGALYPSKRARAQFARDGKPLRYDLPESLYKHPWSWFGPPPAGAYAFYEQYFLGNATLLATLPALVGKRIACWCKDGRGDRCQADVLVKYANLYAQHAFELPPSVTDFFA